MASPATTHPLRLAGLILGGDTRFYWLIGIYGLVVSALTLAIPLSVQTLVSTVANTALVNPVIVLSTVLGLLLGLSALFAAMQVYVMELFERRFFSRIVTEVAMRLVYARYAYLETINRDELVNRYFDVMTVQKSLPPLLSGVLATILQTAVGLALTSFYHPVFVVFNIIFLFAVWFIWRLFDRGAGRTSIELSTAKYAAAEWLESLTRCNSFYKSERGIAYAIAKTLESERNYVAAHRRHFRYNFAQTVGFLLLYAVASAALLGVAGWLVVRGQLSLGQLVAAELVLTAVFANISRLGYYLELYYDLYAALAKLSQLFTLPLETVRHEGPAEGKWHGELRFDDVSGDYVNHNYHFNLRVKSGDHTLVAPTASSLVKAFTDLVQGISDPEEGEVYVGGLALPDFNQQRLRDQLHVIDTLDIPDCTIAELLAIADPEASRIEIRDVLRCVELVDDIDCLDDGLDHEITAYGYPLTPSGVVKLKLAYALLCKPRILVLTPLFDVVSRRARTNIKRNLRALKGLTVVWISNRRDLNDFDRYVLLGRDRQPDFEDLASLVAAEAEYERLPEVIVPLTDAAAATEGAS